MARIKIISGKEEVMGFDYNTVVLLVIAVELGMIFNRLPQKK
jgi:hypothetical protein